MERLVFSSNGADLTLASAITILGFNWEDISNVLSDTISGEITENAVWELLEHVGVTIPYIGPAFIAIKIMRYLYNFRDRTEDIETLKREIKDTLGKYLDDICTAAKGKVEEDCNELVKKILKKCKENFERAKVFRAKAAYYF